MTSFNGSANPATGAPRPRAHDRAAGRAIPQERNFAVGSSFGIRH